MKSLGVSLALSAFLALSTSCRDEGSPEAEIEAGAAPEPVATASSAVVESPPTELVPHFDFIDNLARCEPQYQGASIDLGTPFSYGLDGSYSLAPEREQPILERDGAQWALVHDRTISFRFVQERTSQVFVSLRAKGRRANRVAIAVDDISLGTIALDRRDGRVVKTRGSSYSFPPGEHTVTLRFVGRLARGNDPLAEIDWIRIAPVDADRPRSTYQAPTLRDISYSASLGGIPHRSIALRPSGKLHCTTSIGRGARLRGAVGFAGLGEGQAEIRALRDGEEPLTLGSFQVKGGEKASFVDFDLPLDALEGQVAAIELHAVSGAPSGRVLFGDPVVVVPRAVASKPPSARLVVVVVLSSLEASRFPPRAEAGSLPILEELRQRSTVYLRHRSPTSFTGASVASLLTGLSPRTHGLEDLESRLPEAVTTIAEAARDGSIQTAMFTGSPTTFAPFGFDQGYDRFFAISPVSGISSTAPLTEAASWVGRHLKDPKSRALVVVHARGGHPPWDVTGAEAADLLPHDYSGPMEPRRSAQVLGRARSKRTRFRLTENDRIRMWGLYEKGLEGQDRALGTLVETIRKEGLWDETMFVVTGDVGISTSSRAPFGEGEDLDEASLEIPLWVRFAKGELQGVEVDTPTTPMDVAGTVLAALDLPVPKGFESVDLHATALGPSFPAARPLGAVQGDRYSVRFGDHLLIGTAGRFPMLCDRGVDPACENDRLEAAPLLSRAMFRWMWVTDLTARKARHVPREAVVIDDELAAAMSVWGL